MDIIRSLTHSAPEVLGLEQAPNPEPAPDLRVGPALLNSSNTMLRRGDALFGSGVAR